MFSYILNLHSYPELIFICDVHLLWDVIIEKLSNSALRVKDKVLYLHLLDNFSTPGEINQHKSEYYFGPYEKGEMTLQ